MPQSAPVTIASIDAGSNAIRLQISAIVGGRIVPLETERVAIRLGSNAFTVGELDRETIDAAVAAFYRFRKLFDYHKVEHYRAVATSATRTVRNREQLLGAIQYESGIDLEVIDGEEEFRLVRSAVIEAMKDRVRPPYLVDLGGGSLEVGHEVDGNWESISLPIGTVRLMEHFGISGSMSEDEERMLRRYVRGLLERNGIHAYRRSEEKAIVATGGNAEALAKTFGRDDNGLSILTRKELEAGLSKLLRMNESAREAAWGMRRDRAEVIGIAGLIFLTVMELLEVDELQAPNVGVREGILLDIREQVLEGRGEVPPQATLLGAFRMLMQRLGHDWSHGEEVRRLSVQLFEQLRPLHKLPNPARLVLELAALAHDVGEVVERKAHHRHSEYIVLHGRVPGLTSPMREMVAALCRAHRKSFPDPAKHAAYAKLARDQKLWVDRLIPLLRIADALHTDHRNVVRHVGVRQENSEWVMTLHMAREVTHMAPFTRRNGDFEKVFGVPLRMETTVESKA